jgi:hypothetical protein
MMMAPQNIMLKSKRAVIAHMKMKMGKILAMGLQ